MKHINQKFHLFGAYQKNSFKNLTEKLLLLAYYVLSMNEAILKTRKTTNKTYTKQC